MENIYCTGHSILVNKSFLDEILKTEVIIIELTKVECAYTFLDGADYGLCFTCLCTPNYLQALLTPHSINCFDCGHVYKNKGRIIMKATSGGSLKSFLESKRSQFGDDVDLFDQFIEAIIKPKGHGY